MDSISIFIDGGCKNNGTSNAEAYGSMAVCFKGEVKRTERWAFRNALTNNEAEYGALMSAFNYLLAEPNTDAAVTFTLPVQAAGSYAVRLNFPAHTNRASNVRIVVEYAGGTAIEHIDQRSFGFGLLLGFYEFVPGKPARVTINTATADGRVAIEGIGFARASESLKR